MRWLVLPIILSLSWPAYAGWGNDFAQGFFNGSNAERQALEECEETYSRRVCAEMAAEKKDKEAEDRRHQQMEWELERQRARINQLEQSQRNGR